MSSAERAAEIPAVLCFEALKRRAWEGGKVGSHAELDAADQAFWERAGPEERLLASIELAFQSWRLAHPNDLPPRFGRDAFGVRRRKS